MQLRLRPGTSWQNMRCSRGDCKICLDQNEEKLHEISYIEKRLEIKGVRLRTVFVAVAEIGDIGHLNNQTAAETGGVGMVSNDSWRHNRESWIIYL